MQEFFEIRCSTHECFSIKRSAFDPHRRYGRVYAPHKAAAESARSAVLARTVCLQTSRRSLNRRCTQSFRVLGLMELSISLAAWAAASRFLAQRSRAAMHLALSLTLPGKLPHSSLRSRIASTNISRIKTWRDRERRRLARRLCGGQYWSIAIEHRDGPCSFLHLTPGHITWRATN